LLTSDERQAAPRDARQDLAAAPSAVEEPALSEVEG
jgi:hypothetical protein